MTRTGTSSAHARRRAGRRHPGVRSRSRARRPPRSSASRSRSTAARAHTPTQSTASLVGADTAKPTITLDQGGAYHFALVVKSGALESVAGYTAVAARADATPKFTDVLQILQDNCGTCHDATHPSLDFLQDRDTVYQALLDSNVANRR